MAIKAHEGQTRAGGEPYVSHVIAVSQILEGWGMEDEELIVAALLHDTVEDDLVALSEIEGLFGKRVAQLVDAVSKFRSDTGVPDDRETLKKVLVQSYLEPRVAVLKLADRLHNMRTMYPMPEKKRIAKSRETLDVYTRLAESLGMWEVKIELEDVAFQYVGPQNYQDIAAEVDGDSRLTLSFLRHWESNLTRLITEQGSHGSVDIRKNGYYSLYDKRRRLALEGKSSPTNFAQINDVVSFRVLLPELGDCYRFIGTIHQEFGEHVDFDRYDEFVGVNRRTNGYSALQTTLDLPQGAIEIAVATEEMEEFNRWGVVSLLRKGERALSDYLLKLVFTPTGEVRFLPRSATGVDFAYSISERLGAQAESLLVDGQSQPLTYVVPNASTVEVILADEPQRAPDAELRFYCLPATRNTVERQLIIKERDQYAKQGKEILEGVIETRGLLDLVDLGKPLTKLIYGFGCQSLEDLYFKVGGGYVVPSDVARWLDREGMTKEGLGWTTIRVSGVDQPGILDDVATWIHNLGGNIINIGLTMDEGRYQLRLVIDGLNDRGEDSIREILTTDRRFEQWKLV